MALLTLTIHVPLCFHLHDLGLDRFGILISKRGTVPLRHPAMVLMD